MVNGGECKMAEIPEGMIELGDDAANILGFTDGLFDGYLWCKDGAIYISFIESKEQRKGHVRRLMDTITAFGFMVKVPTPFARMEAICKREGFRHATEETLDGDVYDCWVRPPFPINMNRWQETGAVTGSNGPRS